MSTAPVLSEEKPAAETASPSSILVCVPSLGPDALESVAARLAEAFPGQHVVLATPETPAAAARDNITVLPYTPQASAQSAWVLNANDFLNAWTVVRDATPRAVLILGPDAATVSAPTLRRLAEAVASGQDLVLPRYPVGPHDALVNSAILYPLTRALFAQPVRFPLPVDIAASRRMSELLAKAAQRHTAAGQGEALLWPVAEAAIAGRSVCDTAGDLRALPQPNAENLNSLLATVAGSLFADIESKAAFWQRARLAGRSHPRNLVAEVIATTHDETPLDLAPMIESFRNAYTNLRELWSLVLPPNSLLSLKKLSLAPAESFVMPDAIWARTVYDFLLAYRLRTINRGHLLGALTPLYLAWVASHVGLAAGDAAAAERHVESVAAAFENDKPYLVARWRWPDRFNP